MILALGGVTLSDLVLLASSWESDEPSQILWFCFQQSEIFLANCKRKVLQKNILASKIRFVGNIDKHVVAFVLN